MASLESLYNSAVTGTYVNKVRTEQGSDATAPSKVSFMDGQRRSTETTADTDVFQKEFQRQSISPVGGAQGTIPSTNDKTYPLSRWTSRALQLAFEAGEGQKGPSSLTKGFYDTTRFRVWQAGQTEANIHNYIPSVDRNASLTGGYINQFSWARTRYNATPVSR